jgi:hypothetical protein
MSVIPTPQKIKVKSNGSTELKGVQMGKNTSGRNLRSNIMGKMCP